MARHGRMSVTLGKVGVWISAIGVLTAAAAIAGFRLELLSLNLAFGGYGVSALFVALGALIMLVAMVGGRGGLGGWKLNSAAWIALILGVGMTLNNLLWLRQGQVSPLIHDITTDTANPPIFVDVLPLRAGSPNPPNYAGGEVTEMQLAAYPEIETLLLDVPAGDAISHAEQAAVEMGWEVVNVVPEEGRLEAVDTTSWFGFKDDVVVRISNTDRGCAVDVRSKSRLGLTDVGTNARRIRRFLALMRSME